MAETLGSLVDKLTIVDLKIWHCQEQLFSNKPVPLTIEEKAKLRNKNESLLGQRQRLIQEIDEWFVKAITAPDTIILTNPQNKIYGQFRKE